MPTFAPARLILISLALLLLNACARAPLYLHLDPAVTTASFQSRAGMIALRVSDDSKPASLNDQQTRYLLDTPALQVVEREIADALRAQGFQVNNSVSSSASQARVLEVHIVKLDHIISKGMVTDNIVIDLSFTFTARSASGTLTRQFNDSRNRDVGGNAKIGEVAGDLNQALGEVLSRALGDNELMQYLSK